MKRYAIFAALGPLLGGFLLLLTATVNSGYWSYPQSPSEAERWLMMFAKTLRYSYLFGLVPSLMLGAVDDILFHVKRIGAVRRLLIVGAVGFAAAELLRGLSGGNSGTIQFVLYGLVGCVPGVISSGLACWLLERQPPSSRFGA